MAEVSEVGHFSRPHENRFSVHICEGTWHEDVAGDEYIFLHYEVIAVQAFRPHPVHNLFQLSASN